MANSSLYQSIKNAALKYPNNNALLFMGKYVDYTTFVRKIDKIASGLANLGVKQGSVVSMAMPNIFEAIYAFYAVNKLGAIAHMVHPLTPVKQMERFMAKSQSKILIIIDTFYQHYSDLLENKDITMILASPVQTFGIVKKLGYKVINRTKLSSIDRNNPQLMNFAKLYSNDFSMEPETSNPKDTCVYLHSGGTSGDPKTIELSSFAINSLALKLPFIIKAKSYTNKHMLGVLPMFHGFGLCMGIHAILLQGGVATLMPKFDAKTAVKLIKKNQINYVIGVPSLFESLLAQPDFAGEHLKNLDQAYIGGDYVATDLHERFNKTMEDNHSQARLLEGYGLTEVVTVCSVNTLSEYKLGTVGRPMPDIDIMIVDVNTREPLPAASPGEIAVSGDTMMNGYLYDEKATKATFLVDSSNKKWVLTGDYGFIDSDGYLHFKQRLKRIVKVLGIPVMPSEIENLMMSLKEVKEVAAIGVPDKAKGFAMKLYLALDKSVPRQYDDEGIKDLIKKEISVYAVPKEICYREALPKTTIGKIDVRKLEAEN
ncbi:MAG: acyl--CoA ligase [Bacilli bacterium]|nr:acyl--CoA ligase [Bacilli bacterium]MBN2696341.1 acyl--CoA ligase [Bacilli bacterium]